MPLLNEYSLVPDIFSTTSYSSEEAGRLCLQYLKESLLDDGIIRDLRAGDWLESFKEARPWHSRGKELLKKVITQNRLRKFPAILADDPSDDLCWCKEALASHAVQPITGVIAAESTKNHFSAEQLVGRIDQLSSSAWWTSKSCSCIADRTFNAYKMQLELILSCSNSIMFIDPHLDPTKRGYSSFGDILRLIGTRTPSPLIEIHRVNYSGSGRNRVFLSNSYFEEAFKDHLSEPLREIKQRANIYIWPEAHERFLITDLMGINIGIGFDTGGRHPKNLFNRLGRDVRDAIQRDYDPAYKRPVHRFQI